MDYFDSNRKLWDSRVEAHVRADLYDMPGFMAGKSSLTEIERDALGEVEGKTLLHLQCHFGQDTLSWERRGAVVTGVDFSEEAIKKAEEIRDRLQLGARFITANVYDLPDVLSEKFDIVFTTYGAIPWLPDLGKWAKIVGRFLKKGGLFYLAEFHPALYMFNFDNYRVEYSYFNEGKPYCEEVTGSYADKESQTAGTEYFWNHSMSEIINPLIREGLVLQELNEYDFSPYHVFPNMREREPGRYVWGEKGTRIPHIFSLKMTRQ